MQENQPQLASPQTPELALVGLLLVGAGLGAVLGQPPFLLSVAGNGGSPTVPLAAPPSSGEKAWAGARNKGQREDGGYRSGRLSAGV